MLLISRRVGLRYMQSIGGKAPYTPLWYDGLELANFNKWDTVTNMTIVTSPVHHGTYAAYATASHAFMGKRITGYSHLFYRWFQNFTNMTVSTGGDILAEIRASDLFYIMELSYTSGPPFKIYMMDWDDPTNGYFEGQAITDGWHCIIIEMHRVSGGYIRVWLDDTLQFESSRARPNVDPWDLFVYAPTALPGYAQARTVDCFIIDIINPTSKYYPHLGV